MGIRSLVRELFNKQYKDSATMYWRCSETTCSARLITIHGRFFSSSGSHNHPPNPSQLLKEDFLFKVKERVKTEMSKSVKRVYDEEVASMDEAAASVLPKFKSIERILYRVRKFAKSRISTSLENGPMPEDARNVDNRIMSGISLPVKRRMFFLVVCGVMPDEPNTILKITQESTTRDVIAQSLSKSNKEGTVDDYVLIEEVQQGWEKKPTDRKVVRRFLDLNERPLEAQAQWQGEGKFILKKLTDVNSSHASVSTNTHSHLFNDVPMNDDVDVKEEVMTDDDGSNDNSTQEIPVFSLVPNLVKTKEILSVDKELPSDLTKFASIDGSAYGLNELAKSQATTSLEREPMPEDSRNIDDRIMVNPSHASVCTNVHSDLFNNVPVNDDVTVKEEVVTDDNDSTQEIPDFSIEPSLEDTEEIAGMDEEPNLEPSFSNIDRFLYKANDLAQSQVSKSLEKGLILDEDSRSNEDRIMMPPRFSFTGTLPFSSRQESARISVRPLFPDARYQARSSCLTQPIHGNIFNTRCQTPGFHVPTNSFHTSLSTIAHSQFLNNIPMSDDVCVKQVLTVVDDNDIDNADVGNDNSTQEVPVFSLEPNLEEIRELQAKFAEDRDWDQYHTPRNLLLALVGEVGELSAIFIRRRGVEQGLHDWNEAEKEHLGQELSDVLLYLVRLSEKCDIDLPSAVMKRIALGTEKTYPHFNR